MEGCPDCHAEGGMCMAHGGVAQDRTIDSNEVAVSDTSMDVLSPADHKKHNMDVQKYAEGGAVDDEAPLKEHSLEDEPENEDLHPEMSDSVDSRSLIRPGITSESDSDNHEDLPQRNEHISLSEDVMNDRKRRMMSKGGYVSSKGSSSLAGDLDQKTDLPEMSDLDNDADEMSAPVEDGRMSRGLNLEPVHDMTDPEHDISEASLVNDIIRDRKMRRRG
jgi:hypothetical protein